MLKHSTTLTVIGFILFFLGLVSILLNLVGVDIFFLSWLYTYSVALSFAVRLAMIIGGVVLIYVGQTDWSREEL
ncbi:hypothetical protein LEM8419_02467 [Neolewinella maritima]|uniref:Uncharacterized protein n=1 Tax=Neolewinella maritima TaxID=1383882 RepID=A0ABM9B2J4_9BACT|nr:hypothetical protein [Neolewinella maritima]CAH1001564.1 hypothetical protein LEM8419_02467 [Neolewinella maritima]